MKFKILSVRTILVTSFLIAGTQLTVFSQGNDTIKAMPSGLFIGLMAGPNQTQITNEGISSFSGIVSKKMNSFNGTVEIGYFFTKNLGLSSGIGYNSYKSEISLNTYQSKSNAIDSEKEAYELQVSGSNILEDQKINFLSVPICLNVRLPFAKVIGLFVKGGVNFAIPISKNYTSQGTFTYKGSYPQYNVLLENLPAYGFPTNRSVVSGGELAIKSLNVMAMASAGLDFMIQPNIQLAVAFSYNKSLSNVSSYTSQDKFQLTPEVDKMNSFMAKSSNTSVESMGINLCLRYFLK